MGSTLGATPTAETIISWERDSLDLPDQSGQSEEGESNEDVNAVMFAQVAISVLTVCVFYQRNQEVISHAGSTIKTALGFELIPSSVENGTQPLLDLDHSEEAADQVDDTQ